MFIGPDLFVKDKHGDIVMQLVPALPSWLFEDEGSDKDPTFDEDGNHVVTFKLFGAIPVTYHNPGGKNLFGESPKSYNVTFKHGKPLSVDGPTIPNKAALEIRRVSGIKSIDVYF